MHKWHKKLCSLCIYFQYRIIPGVQKKSALGLHSALPKYGPYHTLYGFVLRPKVTTQLFYIMLYPFLGKRYNSEFCIRKFGSSYTIGYMSPDYICLIQHWLYYSLLSTDSTQLLTGSLDNSCFVWPKNGSCRPKPQAEGNRSVWESNKTAVVWGLIYNYFIIE